MRKKIIPAEMRSNKRRRRKRDLKPVNPTFRMISGKDLQLLIKILKDKGIEADETTSLRSVADKMGLTPREVYDLLTVK